MRYSKRMRSPGIWLDEHSWEERMECRKRRKQDSHSSERENKSRRTHHHLRICDGHYLETRSLNKGLDSRDRSTQDPMACEEVRREGTSKDRDWHHYSKSSGRSGRSGRSRRSSRRPRDRRRKRSHSRHKSSSVREPPSPPYSPLYVTKWNGSSMVFSQSITPISFCLSISLCGSHSSLLGICIKHYDFQ